jgi:D-glycero-beta-D-manno-heptose 1-phosphate adenylyltransferase
VGQVVELGQLLDIVKNLKKENKTIVTTNGCFDIIHVGHVRYLKQAKDLGDVLIIALNSDYSVKRLKGPTRPINSENDRAEVLSSLCCVDYVVIFNEDTPAELLSKIKPDIHVKGGDYDINTLPEAPVIKKAGGKIVFIPFVEGKSTTNIINNIALNTNS